MQKIYMQTLTIRRWTSSVLIFSTLSVLIVFIAILFGSEALRPYDVIKTLIETITGHHDTGISQTILFQIRLPRILLAVVVGGSLAAAGGVFQAILKNPLADPYVLGISSGAALGVLISLFAQINITILGFTSTTFLAFMGAIMTLYIVYKLSNINGRTPPQTILLVGVMINAIIFAIILFLTLVIDSNQFYKIFFWLFGYISSPDYTSLAIISLFAIAGLIILLTQAGSINLLTLGDDTAQTLGLDVERVKRKIFIACALLVAAAVSLCGPIGFLGIIVPHIVRLLFGYDYRIILPISVIGGGIFLVIADTLARTVISPVEIPVGIVTALCGGPYFIYLMRRKRIV